MTRKQISWIIVTILGFIIFGLHQEKAKAEPIQYYGTPFFYSKFVADSFDCVYTERVSYGFCGDIKYPEEGVVGYTIKGEPDQGEGAVIRFFQEVICLDGICETNFGERVGSTDVMGTSYWYIPVGFYMDIVNGKTRVFKHGTGPSGSKYQMRNIKDLPEYEDPPRGLVLKYKDTVDRYDVYCNQADECSYMGRIMLASQLHNFIPNVLTHNCSSRFCYNQDGTIAGLNPRAK